MAPSVLLDDSTLATGINLLGNNWQRQTGQSGAYNGTETNWKSGGSSSTSVPPQLNLTFSGTDVNIYGSITSSMAANYSIDGGTPTPVVFPLGVDSDQTGIDLFSISNLADNTAHSLNFYPLQGQLTVDFVTYTPASNAPLNGMRLILDDMDPAIAYSNNQWNHTTLSNIDAGRPYKGTITGTNVQGATMQLNFQGSDIAVFGVLNELHGSLAATFSVDNGPVTTFSPFDGDQDSDDDDWRLAKQFFYQSLSAGQHTLYVTLTSVSQQQVLWIDSVSYTATSATTLAGASAPGTISNSGPGSSNGSGSGAGSGSGSGKNDNGNSGNGGNTGSHGSSFPKASIAGIAFALIAFFMLSMFLLRNMRKRRALLNSVKKPIYSPVAPPSPSPINARTSMVSVSTLYNPHDGAAPPVTRTFMNNATALQSEPEIGPLYNPHLPNVGRSASAMASYSLPTSQLERSRSSSAFALSPPPEPPHRRQTMHVTHISTGSVERDPFAATAQTYYTYSGKDHLIGLQWGDVVPPAQVSALGASEKGTKAADKGKRISTRSNVPSKRTSTSTEQRSGTDEAPAPPAKEHTRARTGGTSATADANRARASSASLVSPVVEGSRTEAGTSGPSRAIDAGPLELPPAYNDDLYRL